MPVIVTSSIGTGVRISTLLNTSYIITGGATIQSTDTTSIEGGAAGVSIYVTAGSQVVGSAFAGIFLSGATASGKSIEVDFGALVSAVGFAVACFGDGSEIINRGQIVGGSYGIIFQTTNAAHVTTIENSGQIIGEIAITRESSGDLGTLELNNSGQIIGLAGAMETAVGTVIKLLNTGDIRGDILIGNMNDLINTAQGTIDGEINMGAGNDTLAPGLGVEIAIGGDGVDLLDFSTQSRVKVDLAGFAANFGAAAGDSYVGFENVRGSATGSDVLRGNGLGNRLLGLGGDDTLDGGQGDDTLVGGAGNDVFIIDSASDVVQESANGGQDSLRTSVSLTLATNVENGSVLGAVGLTLTGNGLANRLTGATGSDTLIGGGGSDTLIGGGQGDSLEGGAGDDRLDGGSQADILRGGAGNDTYLVDNTGDLVIEASNQGRDLILTQVSLELFANVEDATVTANGGRALTGNSLNNLLTGGKGNDSLYGGSGQDSLIGGQGNDRLQGDSGADELTGGLGADQFTFVSRTDGIDHITDFDASDVIAIDAAGFGGGLVVGALADSAFVARADNLAQDADDRFIFRTTDNSLWFDRNGTGAGGLVQIAVIDGSIAPTAADFVLI